MEANLCGQSLMSSVGSPCSGWPLGSLPFSGLACLVNTVRPHCLSQFQSMSTLTLRDVRSG